MDFAHISYWTRGIHNPLGNINEFNEKPSPALAYVIGAMLSDGSKYYSNKHYYITLGVKDKEFAKEFGRNLAKVLEKRKPCKSLWNKSNKVWIIRVSCILLYKFLEKPYIEYNKDCVSVFLKALFDGEGCVYINRKIYKRELILSNTNKELLNYVKYLLKKYFNIETIGPHLTLKAGKNMYFPNGRISKTTKDYCYIYICTKSLLNFYKYIGFSIKRKQQRLIKAIKQ